jgi:hypothetical protein
MSYLRNLINPFLRKIPKNYKKPGFRERGTSGFSSIAAGGGEAYSLYMEPTTGIEPVNLILTKDVLYLLSYVGPRVERETGLEPATLSLEG